MKYEYYSDEKNKIINPDLFSNIAQEKADSFSFYNEKHKKTEKELESTQLRKFYNEVLMLRGKIESADGDEAMNLEFDRQLPFINMIKAKVFYAQNKKNPSIKGSKFPEFIKAQIDYINEKNKKEYFFIFCTLFESIIAYTKK